MAALPRSDYQGLERLLRGLGLLAKLDGRNLIRLKTKLAASRQFQFMPAMHHQRD